MKCSGLFELPILLSIGTRANYDKLSYGVSVIVVMFEPGSSQEPRQKLRR